MMDPKIKAKWVAALRSGEYRQGRSHLARTDSSGETRHCCLGVLCDLAVKDGVTLEVGARSWGSLHAITYDGDAAALPRKVVEWAGLPSVDPTVDTFQLSSHNDQGATFTEIANMIEASL